MALIDLIEISKKFGEKVIFDGANFSINEGERVAIIGKNGEGKSTLMKIICGEYELDDGRKMASKYRCFHKHQNLTKH